MGLYDPVDPEQPDEHRKDDDQGLPDVDMDHIEEIIPMEDALEIVAQIEEGDDPDEIHREDGWKANEESKKPLPPRRGLGQDCGEKDGRGVEAVAAVFDVNGEEMLRTLHPEERGPLCPDGRSQELEDAAADERDECSERLNRGQVNELEAEEEENRGDT